jgi:hypothetical protein
MPIEFCLPKSGKAVPSGPDWLHEVKYDGYRLRVERHGGVAPFEQEKIGLDLFEAMRRTGSTRLCQRQAA